MPSANGYSVTIGGTALNSRTRAIRFKRFAALLDTTLQSSNRPIVPSSTQLPQFPEPVLASVLAPPSSSLEHFLVSKEVPRTVPPEKLPSLFSARSLALLGHTPDLGRHHGASLYAIAKAEHSFSLTFTNETSTPAEALIYFNGKLLDTSWYVLPGKTVTVQGHRDLASGTIRPFFLSMDKNEYCTAAFCQSYRDAQRREGLHDWKVPDDLDLASKTTTDDSTAVTIDSECNPSTPTPSQAGCTIDSTSFATEYEDPTVTSQSSEQPCTPPPSPHSHATLGAFSARGSQDSSLPIRDFIRVEFVEIYRSGVRVLPVPADVVPDLETKPQLQWVYSRKIAFPLAVIDIAMMFLEERVFTVPAHIAKKYGILYRQQLPASANDKRKRDDYEESDTAEDRDGKKRIRFTEVSITRPTSLVN